MPRARGNARKKKARLTDQTLSAVMQVARPVVDSPVADAAAVATTTAAENQGQDQLDAPVSAFLDLLQAEPDAATIPAAYNDAARVFDAAPWFPAGQFVFGIVVCPACHNEMIYYQQRAVLADGYHFRCRICQHELLASLD